MEFLENGGLENLAHLSLRHNKLQESIPDSVSNMVGLEFLDLSHNNISGTIPNISMFLSKNCMVKYPRGVLSRISRISFSSTMKHCVVLQDLVSRHAPLHQKAQIKQEKIASSTSFAGNHTSICSYHLSIRISCYEFLQATDALSESNLIGSGSFGSVYKGILGSGTAIAVKVFNLQVDEAFKSFDMECEILRNLRHMNLVKVITSCSNLDFKALVLRVYA
ncbi:hypothetical protein T459_11596 [Capsicum annuum]|uniref:Protein kinase domain-containing protein n=1 Tax=Capsicum annuum TaxID=4072 RepID=A0A2G2ZMF3_CAPAN|nr:hypothetical protein T459_11596 [Capsicum annuum]